MTRAEITKIAGQAAAWAMFSLLGAAYAADQRLWWLAGALFLIFCGLVAAVIFCWREYRAAPPEGAMTARTHTTRGFRLFDEAIPSNPGTLRVQESSIMGEGAHVRLLLDGVHQPAIRHDIMHPHLNVAAAKRLVAALQMFIAEAETDRLTEPAIIESTTTTETP